MNERFVNVLYLSKYTPQNSVIFIIDFDILSPSPKQIKPNRLHFMELIFHFHIHDKQKPNQWINKLLYLTFCVHIKFVW